jgi:hypothetical protein
MKAINKITAVSFFLVLGMIVCSVTGWSPIFVEPAMAAAALSITVPQGVLALGYGSLEELDGAENPGSFESFIYYAPRAYFQDIATYPVSPAAIGDDVTISDPHNFKSGKGWHKIFFTYDKSKFEGEGASEKDVTGLKELLEGGVAGNTPRQSSLCKKMQTTKGIYLVPDTNGSLIQIGHELRGACMTVKHTMGDNPLGWKGWMVNIEGYMKARTFYTGSVPENQLHPDDQASGS